MNRNTLHSFHIPVMGIGFTIDTPLRVAKYGISSVISTVDDILVERLRKFYSEKFDLPYQEISAKVEDFRAKRFTAYLDMIHDLAVKGLEDIKKSFNEKTTEELEKLINMLPSKSSLKENFRVFAQNNPNAHQVYNWLNEHLKLGDIDVNIMTKVDRDNYKNGKKLDVEYNDAHAALRGFANSKLETSVVLSAGMNPRLYAYLENFDAFYPHPQHGLRKKIILKVSDYRSALIQGKYLAKRGIWISEYRIESGLNCGGHAFASDGVLMGPILEDFKANKDNLIQETHQLLAKALSEKGRFVPEQAMNIRITAQGGVGTHLEHEFLLEKYNLDSVGWGSPFLLADDVVSIDNETLSKLIDAREEDLYLSNISPLGVPFNSLRGNTKDLEKIAAIESGKPGSNCPKQFVKLNYDFGEKALCTASRQYQTKKIAELDRSNLTVDQYQFEYSKITDKACICVGLSTATLKANNLDFSIEGPGVSVCPGPNIAYFSKKTTLQEMCDHIYGRTNIIQRNDRPNMFVKELNLYVDYFRNKISELNNLSSGKEIAALNKFKSNLISGIDYYTAMFDSLTSELQSMSVELKEQFYQLRSQVEHIVVEPKLQTCELSA